jgi:hypothetical protein
MPIKAVWRLDVSVPRSFRKLTLLIGLAILGGGLMPTQATASQYCGEDHGIWLTQSNDSGYGSWSEIFKVNDALDTCPSGTPLAGSAFVVHTAGVAFSLTGSSFVEVGLYRSSSTFGGIQNHVFGEYGFYPATVGGPYFYTTYTTGGNVDMKVTNQPGTWDWKLYWDYPNGGSLTWVLLDELEGMFSQYGWAWGEHARVGETGTGTYDHHYDMQFKRANGNWTDINELKCWIDNEADLSWHDISDIEFEIQEGHRECTPSM